MKAFTCRPSDCAVSSIRLGRAAIRQATSDKGVRKHAACQVLLQRGSLPATGQANNGRTRTASPEKRCRRDIGCINKPCISVWGLIALPVSSPRGSAPFAPLLEPAFPGALSKYRQIKHLATRLFGSLKTGWYRLSDQATLAHDPLGYRYHYGTEPDPATVPHQPAPANRASDCGYWRARRQVRPVIRGFHLQYQTFNSPLPLASHYPSRGDWVAS